jgi:oligopeptide/dipeptide ABC transporter ATP-binding protein
VLFITHDLSLLIEIADSIAIMYGGRIVERAQATALFRAPRHPYTLGLLGSFPSLHGPRVHMTGIAGSPPDLRDPPAGCPFHPRCRHVMERCRTELPPLRPDARAGVQDPRVVACWLQDGSVPPPAELARSEPGPDPIPNPPPIPDPLPSREVPHDSTGADPALPVTSTSVLEGRSLVKHFPVHRRGRRTQRGAVVHAVDDVSIAVPEASITAVVGESGCGKSTLTRMLARLIRPTAGELVLNGSPAARRDAREYAGQVQMVLQDPFASLNLVHTVRYHLARPLRIHGPGPGRQQPGRRDNEPARARRAQPADVGKYPHELSGGQRQRVAIARALAVRPRVLLADEPVSMLDVSIRLGVLNLLADLRERERLALVYVTHDIASARYLGDTIASCTQARSSSRARPLP